MVGGTLLQILMTWLNITNTIHIVEDIDDCKYNPCLNNGKCVDRVGSYECVCEDGWTGQNCEKQIEMCSVATCKNDASCINLFQDYFCVCPKGTDGKQCEVICLENDF